MIIRGLTHNYYNVLCVHSCSADLIYLSIKMLKIEKTRGCMPWVIYSGVVLGLTLPTFSHARYCSTVLPLPGIRGCRSGLQYFSVIQYCEKHKETMFSYFGLGGHYFNFVTRRLHYVHYSLWISANWYTKHQEWIIECTWWECEWMYSSSGFLHF